MPPRRETIDTPSDLITDFAGLVSGDIVTWRLSMPIVGLAAIRLSLLAVIGAAFAGAEQLHPGQHRRDGSLIDLSKERFDFSEHPLDPARSGE